MGIEIKTLGMLFDELSITNIKCFIVQEKIGNENISTEKRLEAAVDAQKLNKRRNLLIQAIDNYLNQTNDTVTGKTY